MLQSCPLLWSLFECLYLIVTSSVTRNFDTFLVVFYFSLGLDGAQQSDPYSRGPPSTFVPPGRRTPTGPDAVDYEKDFSGEVGRETGWIVGAPEDRKDGR